LRDPANAVPWLCITGTNGKTATVQMLTAILQAAGHRAVAAGNVGLPLLEAVMDPEPYDVIAVELSSYQLHYTHSASPVEDSFLRGLMEGRLIAQRCPACEKVYFPPRPACPTDGVPTTEQIELSDRGTITTFCVVNVPFLGQRIPPPYVSAYVLLDGADIPFLHLLLGVAPEDVRMGMRVEAVWKPRDEWGPTMQNIDHFKPSGEPDAPFDSYSQHL